jgi:hypothetical protein
LTVILRCMGKVAVFLASLFLILFLSVTSVSASVLVVKKDGTISWNVLASEDALGAGVSNMNSLELKKIAQAGVENSEAKVSLSKDGDKVELNVTGASGGRSMDVTRIDGDLIEIEERPASRQIKIGIVGDKFGISEGDLTAVTNFPISVDPKNAALSVATETGERYLVVLPKDAEGALIKAKTVTKVSGDLTIDESGAGELSYGVSGQKTINVFNLLTLEIPVKATVSATTGEILFVDEPAWLKVFGFAFS